MNDLQSHSLLRRRILPRHAQSYAGLIAGSAVLTLSLWLAPKYAIGFSSNALFAVFLALTFLKVPMLTADYLQENARAEDTPAAGIFAIVSLVVLASVVSLTLALANGGKPDPIAVTLGVASVVLGWFTVQALGALHYAYEYYQAPEEGHDEKQENAGGLQFPGDEKPDAVAFMYFSYTVGTSVATSDVKIASNTMRRRVVVHLVFSHLYNTLLLASAVNVMLSLGGGGGGG
ncbi:putative membrane protein [Devosia subaequoris]|uniref:Putative membrane protein n=1 Tax=Devosia subaequoris TaxID=395930 RepID=A0A7W6IKN0_9HYPH|nr:DUF1345 domain-containing protein [Devosia subaequoris]MBB4051377.1 putative membrane protein [Devosia subaequoris]MCP1208971.1 DUF1345 domain-containing protein [Devosia subaequoris]